MGYKKIVCHPNASGATPRNRKWHVSNVRGVLTRSTCRGTRRADLEHEILLVERQLSAVDRKITPEAIDRLGEIILTRLRSNDPTLRQGHARQFIAKLVIAPDVITITGSVKPLEIAANGDPDQHTPMVPSLDREWCGREDSNFHGLPHSDLNAARLPIPPRPLASEGGE